MVISVRYFHTISIIFIFACNLLITRYHGTRWNPWEMFESIKTKFRIATNGNESMKTSSSLALDIINPSTLVPLRKIQNETPTTNKNQVWSLKAQKLKFEQQQLQLTTERDAKLRFLEGIKRERE
jgi:hypothetical protein